MAWYYYFFIVIIIKDLVLAFPLCSLPVSKPSHLSYSPASQHPRPPPSSSCHHHHHFPLFSPVFSGSFRFCLFFFCLPEKVRRSNLCFFFFFLRTMQGDGWSWRGTRKERRTEREREIWGNREVKC